MLTLVQISVGCMDTKIQRIPHASKTGPGPQFFSDYLIMWISKLQREVALPTMESEVNTLSPCCYELFPLIDMVGEIGESLLECLPNI